MSADHTILSPFGLPWETTSQERMRTGERSGAPSKNGGAKLGLSFVMAHVAAARSVLSPLTNERAEVAILNTLTRSITSQFQRGR